MHDIVVDGGRVKAGEIAEDVGISEERVRNILHKELGIQKLRARWVPHLLNANQKQMCKQFLQQSLDRFNKDTTGFVGQFDNMGG